MKTALLLAMTALLLGGTATAQKINSQVSQSAKHTPRPTIIMVSGNYGGTFLCAKGEMGMTLSLIEGELATLEDMGRDPCRSGRGPCNDKQNAMLAKTYKLNGVLNFFPTLGNPNAPKGTFKVWGSSYYSGKYMTEITLFPGEWLDKPTDFGASGLTAHLMSDGVMLGKPSAQGCSELKLTKLHTQ